jgi:hypothetical protein
MYKKVVSFGGPRLGCSKVAGVDALKGCRYSAVKRIHQKHPTNLESPHTIVHDKQIIEFTPAIATALTNREMFERLSQHISAMYDCVAIANIAARKPLGGSTESGGYERSVFGVRCQKFFPLIRDGTAAPFGSSIGYCCARLAERSLVPEMPLLLVETTMKQRKALILLRRRHYIQGFPNGYSIQPEVH